MPRIIKQNAVASQGFESPTCYTDAHMIHGSATAEGTLRYRDRFPQLEHAGHFRHADAVPPLTDLSVSSIGLGTYLGEPDDAADKEYVDAIALALRSGINVLDTAINYRHQRSERNIGEALTRAIREGDLRRDEVVVCTKAGYLALDGNVPANPRDYFMREYVETGVLDPKDLAGGVHCMAPRFLQNQIERSRRNLGIETIDVFYVHNPETQLADVPRELFRKRLHHTFEFLETAANNGILRLYGIATWNGLRVAEGARDYIGLEETVAIAREIAGDDHHFRCVQLPFNLAMPEAYGLSNHAFQHKHVSLLTAARNLGIAVFGSATLYQGRLVQGLPKGLTDVLGLRTDGENAIQFARSAPGMLTSLIGMGQPEHVERNMRAVRVAPARLDLWEKLFAKNA
jgi:aryl-alcohol dehydrogenase-like predicted oxidoreductase